MLAHSGLRQHLIKQPIIISIGLHLILLLLLILTFEFSEPMAVVVNTANPDTIQAVVIGDTAESKLIAHKQTKPIKKPKVLTPIEKTIAPPVVEEKKLAPPVVTKPVIKKNMPASVKTIPKPEIKAPPAIVKETKVSKTKSQPKLNTFQQALQAQSEKALGDEMLEDIKLKATEARVAAGEINKYKALIVQSISENWIVPVNADRKRSCELMIQLASNGQVRDVQVTKSSGDAQLDSSARAAVFRASPLPVPQDALAFKPFQHFLLKVKPENILKKS